MDNKASRGKPWQGEGAHASALGGERTQTAVERCRTGSRTGSPYRCVHGSPPHMRTRDLPCKLLEGAHSAQAGGNSRWPVASGSWTARARFRQYVSFYAPWRYGISRPSTFSARHMLFRPGAPSRSLRALQGRGGIHLDRRRLGALGGIGVLGDAPASDQPDQDATGRAGSRPVCKNSITDWGTSRISLARVSAT